MKHPLFNKRLIEFYNFVYGECVTSIDGIPSDTLEALKLYTYKELVRPLVYSDHLRGVSFRRLAIKYRLSVMTIRGIVSKAATQYDAAF